MLHCLFLQLMDNVKRKNIFLFFISTGACLLNQKMKLNISNETLRWFMTCYFNDIVGGIAFAAYCNHIFSYYKGMFQKLWKIELLMLSSGFFWEYLTPLFRYDTISDPWDIVAYMFGGFIYWILLKLNTETKYSECSRDEVI